MPQRSPEQKERARWQRILRVYGITREQFDSIDRGYCPICLRSFDTGILQRVVDHDHKTGIIRGILCATCNHRVVGRHRDADLLDRLAAYVRGPHTGWVVPPKPKRKRKKKGK